MDLDPLKTLLLVEDEALIAMAEKAQLEEFGYKVDIAISGEDALVAIDKDPAIDLVLMDIDLGPGIDGPEAAARILARRQIPIVFLSSHRERETVDKTEHITSYGYVVKSSDITVLQASIKMAFKLFEANSKVRESEERFRLLFRNLNSNFALHEIILDAAGRPVDYVFLEVNPAFERVVGVRAEDIVGKRASELFPSTEPYWIEKFGQVALTQEPLHYENYSVELGKYFDMIIYSPQPGQFAMIGLDITDRKKSAEAIAATEGLYHDLVETSQDLIWQCDAEGRYSFLNAAWKDTLGYEVEEMLGKRFTDFQSPEAAARDRAEFTRLLTGTTVKNYPSTHLTKDGRPLNLVFNAKFVRDAAGKVVGTRGTAYDDTARRRAEEELRASLQAKEVLLKETHHRIKNNIATIEGMLALQAAAAQDGAATAPLKEAMGRVQGMRLVYDKLLLTEDYRSVGARDYLLDLARAVMGLFDAATRVALEAEVEDIPLAPKVLFPLGTILHELITNAMKYAYAGRDGGRLAVRLRRAGGAAILAVEDDGPGFPPRRDAAEAHSFGLMLVGMLAEQLKGRVVYGAGPGARCELTFPLD